MSAGYEGDYVNEMLDGYGYADGGRIGREDQECRKILYQ